MTTDRTVAIDAATLSQLAVSHATRLGFDPVPDDLATLRRVHDLVEAVDPGLAMEIAGASSALLADLHTEPVG